jgi:hypothetical protein
MARKSFVQLSADLLTSFPDNINGAITPLVLRTYIQNFLNAIRPAYGLLSRPNATAQTLGTADAAIIFDTGYASDVPDYTTNAPAGTLVRLEAGSTRLTINATIETANGRLITLTLYKNGVATPWRSSVIGQGTGKPIDMTIVALTYEGAQATYQLQGKADAAATSVTFSNMDMLAETVPVNAY